MELGYIKFGEEKLSFSIWTTTSCNFNCSYCYEGGNKKTVMMNSTVLEDTIKFITDICDKECCRNLWVVFHGGEPLLNGNVIKEFVRKIEESGKVDKMFTAMTTNCSIYDETIAEYICELSVSIDGKKETHNRNRKYLDGSDTFDQAMKNAMKYNEIKGGVRLRMVVTPNNVSHFYENVIYLYEMGFKQIVPGVDFYAEDWSEELFDELFCQLEKLREYREKHMDETVEIGILDEKITEKTRCYVGCDGYNILPDGKIYPCMYAAGVDKYCIGDVCFGLNEAKISELNALFSGCVEECEGCTNKRYCDSNRCFLLNEQLTGNLYEPSGTVCARERLLLKVNGCV